MFKKVLIASIVLLILGAAGAAAAIQHDFKTNVVERASFFARGLATSYEHDSASRTRAEDGSTPCPTVDLEVYRGTHLRYHKPVRVNPEFRERLQRFELLVHRVALDVYEREPEGLIHIGTYNCRGIRSRPTGWSEHAFGNGIDVAGIRFGSKPDLFDRLGASAGRFTVDVEEHWDSDSGLEAKHAEFLHKLAAAIVEDATFRGVIVPPAAGHHDHFHLDMAPWPYLLGDVSGN